MTTAEVAARFDVLAQQEKWFEIHDELFGEDVRSVESASSPYFPYAEGKENVRRKGEDIIRRVTGFFGATTTTPVVAGKHFTVRRDLDITLEGHGRVQISEIMLYEVKDGRIVLEQFFY